MAKATKKSNEQAPKSSKAEVRGKNRQKEAMKKSSTKKSGRGK